MFRERGRSVYEFSPLTLNPEDRASEMMGQQLMTAYVPVNDLQLEQILGLTVPENLAQAAREIGDSLSPKLQ